MKHQVITKDGWAKRARMEAVHGTVRMPVFMNVRAVSATKGAASTDDLRKIDTRMELSSTYHLHVRTGDKLIKELGGFHRFMNQDRPILMGSGGFQVFPLAGLRKIKEEGVYFNPYIDGHKMFMGPKESIQIQSNPSPIIAMAFNKCPPSHAGDDHIRYPVERITRWLARCKTETERLNSLPDTVNREQLLFGINQGGVVEEMCMEHIRTIWEMDLDGYAVSGLIVGESHEEMYYIPDVTVPCPPEDKPVYPIGVGAPANIPEAMDWGVDFFDCVYPSRGGRYGHVYTGQGKLNLFNQKYRLDSRPIEEGCGCSACRSYSRAYIRHLLKVKEVPGMRLCILYNLHFYNTMMKEIRDATEEHRYVEYKVARPAGMEGSNCVTGTASDE